MDGTNCCVLYQDNMFACIWKQTIEKGFLSSSNCTIYMNIQYFFVTNQVSTMDVIVKYCPTNKILDDFRAKPWHVTLFHELEIDIEHQDNYDNSEFSNHDEAHEK